MMLAAIQALPTSAATSTICSLYASMSAQERTREPVEGASERPTKRQRVERDVVGDSGQGRFSLREVLLY